MRPGPVLLEKLWRSWPRVARPYECRSCGMEYDVALHPEVDDKSKVYMRDMTEAEHHASVPEGFGLTFRSGRGRVHARANAYAWCRNPQCPKYLRLPAREHREPRPGSMPVSPSTRDAETMAPDAQGCKLMSPSRVALLPLARARFSGAWVT